MAAADLRGHAPLREPSSTDVGALILAVAATGSHKFYVEADTDNPWCRRAGLDANSRYWQEERVECGAISRTGMSTTSSEMTPKVSFIAWAEDSGRALDIAQALGGEARTFYGLRIVWKPLVPLRYLLNAIGTCGYLISRRPRAVIVTNPPIFPGLIAWLYCAVTKAPLVLDSHPSAFGAAPMSERVADIHAWLTRHAATTMVTVPELSLIHI